MKTTAMLLSLLLLTACGGGGDDADGRPDKTTQPVDCMVVPNPCL